MSNSTSGYSLSSKAMLVFLKVRAWGGTKKDHGETAKVIARNHAEDDAASVTKKLTGKLLLPVQQSERSIRLVHRKFSLPWADDSTRLLPVASFDRYRSEIGALIERHHNVVIPAFAEVYRNEVVPGAPERLGSMYDPDDFPVDIESKFGVDLRFLPIPETSDVRVQLSEAEVNALKAEVEEATREAYEAAGRDIVVRATKPLARLAEAMREFGPGKRLTKSLIENVVDIAELIPALDISGKPEVMALANEIKSLGRYNTTTLSNRSRLRASIATDAERLVAKLSSVF